MTKTVYVIDVKSGNLQSLINAIKKVGDFEVKLIGNAEEFKQAESQIEKLIFPGVGNFAHFVKQLHDRDLVEPIKAYIDAGKSLMGVCVGLQTLFDSSEESEDLTYRGLGYIDMKLKKFDTEDKKFAEKSLRKSVPAIGWNNVDVINVDGKELPQDKAYYGINNKNKYYFVHSYAAIVDEETEEVLDKATQNGWNFCYATYGSEKFIAAVSYKNCFATQFHPEKSGIAGLKVIKSFLEDTKYSEVNHKDFQVVDTKIQKSLDGLTRRIIACLDVRANDQGDLVVTKGDQYNVRQPGDDGSNNVRNLGKPVELATRYFYQGADEVTFLNITSFRDSPLEDLPMLEVLRLAAKNIFVPLTVGGGIKDMTDPKTGKLVPAVEVADLYFRSGADKVSIGSDAVTIAENYYANGKTKTGTTSVETISATFGAQAVVISVDPKRKYVASPQDTTMETIKITDASKFGPNGEQYCYYQVTSQGGRKVHELGALELCLACEALGAGEVLLNSIDHDGSNKGYNLELLRQIKTRVSIPVIASSGAGKPEHFEEVFKMDCGIDAALGAGLFHREEYKVNDVKRFLLNDANMDVRLDDEVEL